MRSFIFGKHILDKIKTTHEFGFYIINGVRLKELLSNDIFFKLVKWWLKIFEMANKNWILSRLYLIIFANRFTMTFIKAIEKVLAKIKGWIQRSYIHVFCQWQTTLTNVILVSCLDTVSLSGDFLHRTCCYVVTDVNSLIKIANDYKIYVVFEVVN